MRRDTIWIVAGMIAGLIAVQIGGLLDKPSECITRIFAGHLEESCVDRSHGAPMAERWLHSDSCMHPYCYNRREVQE